MTFRFLPPAEAELLEAISYYGAIRPELGATFERAVSEAVRNAAANPERGAHRSMLHRLGADANLTLGNKKSVDIAVIRGKGDSLTIDVKGLEGKTGWPIDNIGPGTERHFIVFVCFQGKIDDPSVSPLVWIVPSLDVAGLAYNAPGGRRLMRVSKLRDDGSSYKDAWHALQ